MRENNLITLRYKPAFSPGEITVDLVQVEVSDNKFEYYIVYEKENFYDSEPGSRNRLEDFQSLLSFRRISHNARYPVSNYRIQTYH